MNRIASVVLFVTITASLPAQTSEVGTISSVVGHPRVVRDGRRLFRTVDPGFRLENFDAIATDEVSSLELEFDPATGVDVQVRADPVTQFSIEVSSLRSEQEATIDLAAGSLAIVARSLAGESGFQLRTGSAVMRVRGTTFAVSAGPGGELLVCADDGVVQVTHTDGRSLFASPGQAVEIDEASDLFRTVRHERERVDEFRSQWVANRADRFVGRSPDIVRYHGRRYLEARERFTLAYGELMAHRDVIDGWMEEARRGVRPEAHVPAEGSGLAGATGRARAAMVVYESTAALLTRMAPLLGRTAGRGGIDDVEIVRDVDVAGLYRAVANDRRIMDERAATVRHILKRYSERNGGETPFHADSPD